MDDQEIIRRRDEAMRLRKEVGDYEYRKIKAAKRRQYYEEKRGELREVIEAKLPPGTPMVTMAEMPKPKAQKPRGCSVQVIVTDESGECSVLWNAPALMGTIIASRRNAAGYAGLLRGPLTAIFGKLEEQKK